MTMEHAILIELEYFSTKKVVRFMLFILHLHQHSTAEGTIVRSEVGAVVVGENSSFKSYNSSFLFPGEFCSRDNAF